MVTLEEFFSGNDVVGSIRCNLPSEPHPEELYKVLKEIAARADVADVRVVVTMFDDPDWPFSDIVYIVTTASVDEVMGWYPENLAPDETWDGFPEHIQYEPYTPPAGFRAIGCWWD